jgi:ribonuclease T1
VSLPRPWLQAARLAGALFAFLVALSLGGAAFARGAPIEWVPLAALPPEAQHTLGLIQAGGPFPYERDGVIFGNFEKRLPPQRRGYYHEYTVPTPGARNRGARRIIAGVVGEYYYTADHYQTFQRIRE